MLGLCCAVLGYAGLGSDMLCYAVLYYACTVLPYMQSYYSVLTHDVAGQYLHNAADNSLPALLDKAQGGDVIQDILQVTPWARMCVDATYGHIALSIHVTTLHL